MKNSSPSRTKSFDIAKGFFGWLIFGNLVYALLSFSLGVFVRYEDYLIFISILSSIIWLSTFMAGVRLYFKKQTKILTGLLIAFVSNGVLVNALNLGNSHISFGNVILLMGFPIPGCAIPFMFLGQ